MASFDERDRAQAGRRTLAEDTTDAPVPGRTTLAASLPPAGDEHPVVQAAAATSDEAPPASPPSDAVQLVPPVDDPNGLERIYSDNHKDPHSTHFEPHHNHAEKHKPKVDNYNQKTIKDRETIHAARRSGVVLHDGEGLFTVNKPQVIRYTFTRQGNTNIAIPFDTVDKSEITQINYKHLHKDAPKGKHRLLANPSTPRMLHIGGKDHLCVLTWFSTSSSAWMKVDDLVDGHKIAAVARSRARREDPHATSNDPETLFRQTHRYVIRNDDVGEAQASDKPMGLAKVMGPGQTDGDDLPHYLTKDIKEQAFDANGTPVQGQRVTRSLVALVMNLPEGNTAPIAIDTLLAGQSFFAMKDKLFHRDSPLYLNGKRHTNVLEKWMFGYAGMQDAHGRLRPDPHRRGWVPLRALADTARLQLTDIPQRPTNA